MFIIINQCISFLCCCLVTKLCLTLATSWTVDCQVPLSMEFPRQEYWSGLPFPSPGDLPDAGNKLMPPASAGGFFTTEPPGKPQLVFYSWWGTTMVRKIRRSERWMLEDNATHFLVEIMKVPEILAHVNQEIMKDERKRKH